jgi:hypothetical protein
MHPEAVKLARDGVRQETVPDVTGTAREVDTQDLGPAKLIEEAELNSLAARIDGKVDAAGQDGGAEGRGLSGTHAPSCF